MFKLFKLKKCLKLYGFSSDIKYGCTLGFLYFEHRTRTKKSNYSVFIPFWCAVFCVRCIAHTLSCTLFELHTVHNLNVACQECASAHYRRYFAQANMR